MCVQTDVYGAAQDARNTVILVLLQVLPRHVMRCSPKGLSPFTTVLTFLETNYLELEWGVVFLQPR